MTLNRKRILRLLRTRQTAVLSCLGLIAGFFVVVLGASDRWFAAVYITVGTFAAVIYAFRKLWFRRSFRLALASALAVHLLLIWCVFAVLLRQQSDVGLLGCLPFICVEYYVLSRFAVSFEAERRAPDQGPRGDAQVSKVNEQRRKDHGIAGAGRHVVAGERE